MINATTLRKELIRVVGGLHEPTLLAEALTYLRQLQARDTPPPPGSAAAALRHFGTLSPAEAEQMQAALDQEFEQIDPAQWTAPK